MADKTTHREQRSVPINEAAVREATRAVNTARPRVGDSAEATTRVLGTGLGDLNDRLTRATWDAADTWLNMTSETWNAGARFTLAWLDLCWRLGWDTWTMALERQARISRNQLALWSQWLRATAGEEGKTRQRS